MMNTNEEKQDNKEKKKAENTFKLYRWKKEWVRPYESIYSILRNFCKVNVFQGSYAMKVLDVKGYSTGLPVPKIMMFNKSTQSEHNYDTLYDVLLPEWYRQQTAPVTSLVIPVFSDVVRPTISYCPECAKENYHSFLFQFYHVKECPFHRIPLIETTWRYTLQDSITYLKSEEYIDVQNEMLPCERQLTNDHYQNGFHTTLRYVIPVSSMSNSKTGTFVHMYQLFYNQNRASYTMQIPKYGLDLAELNRRFLEWFDGQKVPTNLCHPERIWKVYNSSLQMALIETDIRTYLEYLLYYLFYEFMKDYDLSSEESYVKIEAVRDSGRELYPDEIFKLKLSYLWAIVSCSDPFYSLNNTWIVSPNSFYAQNARNIYNGVHLPDLKGYDARYRDYISEADGTIIMMYILSDLFQSVWKQLLSIVERDGKINAFHGWKQIRVPEYYICINDGDDFYTVLRYDNTSD